MAVKSHEAKPSAISPLYRKRVELSQNFTTARAITYLYHGYTTGVLYHFFTLVGDISRRQVIFHVGR